MAKKKSNHPTAAATVVGGDSKGRLESLRDLNQLLLKETVERREQVRDLQSCVNRLSEDRSLFIEIEQSFSDLVVTSRITEIAAEKAEAEAALAAVQEMLEAVTSERDAARGDLLSALSEKDSALVELDHLKRGAENARAEAERQRCDLELGIMFIRDLEADKAAMEEKARSMKKDLSSAYDQLLMIQVEKGEIEKELQGLISDSAAYKRDLDAVSEALEEAREKIASCRADNVGLRKQILRMQLEFEADSANLIAEADGLKGRLHNIELEKEEIVEEKISLEAERELSLQKLAEEEELKDLVIEERLHLKEEKEKLQLETKSQKWELEQKIMFIRALEADKAATEEKAMSLEKDLRSTYDQLQTIQGEKIEIEKDMKAIIVSKTAAYERDLDTVSMALEEAWEEIASCRANNFSLTEQIARLQLEFDADRTALIAEMDVLKEEIVEAKVRLNARFSYLQVEKDAILSTKLAEEEKLKCLLMEFGYLQKENEKLQLEINSQKRLHEEEIDGLRETIRKIQAAKREIDGLRVIRESKVVDLQLQISMLQAEKDSAIYEVKGLKKELCNSETALDRLIAENKFMKGDADSLVAEKSVVQEMARATDENFSKVLCLLKATSEKIIQQEIIKSERDSGEDVPNAAVDYLKAIEGAFAAKKQELEVLQCVRAESEKTVGVLAWVCPGIAAVLAAISYAFGVSRS